MRARQPSLTRAAVVEHLRVQATGERRGHSRLQFVQKRPGLFEIGRVEALCERVIERRQQVRGLLPLAHFGQQPGKVARGAELEGQSLLLSGDFHGLTEVRLGFATCVSGRAQSDCTAHAVKLCGKSQVLAVRQGCESLGDPRLRVAVPPRARICVGCDAEMQGL